MRLEAAGVSFSYGNRRILSGISLQADDGDIIALLGRNGSGKTTLMRMLLGFLRPDEGTIAIDGHDILTMDSRTRARAIAYIPQQTETVYPYTVLDAVVMGAAPSLSIFSRPGRKEESRAHAVLDILGIDDLSKRYINQISGGERQLVMIARAIAQDAKILLLDEPTSSLDYSNQLMVMERAEMLREEGYAIILSTHDPAQALTYSTSIIALSEGSILYSGSPQDLMDGRILSSLYGRSLAIREIDTEGGRRFVCVPR